MTGLDGTAVVDSESTVGSILTDLDILRAEHMAVGGNQPGAAATGIECCPIGEACATDVQSAVALAVCWSSIPPPRTSR